MIGWTIEDLEKQLGELIGPPDESEPRVRKRMHILRAATELFARHGYRKTSVDEVAQAAGVAKGTVYSYFTNKTELMIAAIALEKREYLGQVPDVFDPSYSAEDRLRRWVVMMLVLPSRMPLTSALLRGDQEMAAVLAELPPELLKQSTDGGREFLGDLIDKVARPHAWTPSELRDRADVLAGLAFFSSQIEQEHVRRGLSIDRFAEILADLIVGGLRRPKGTEP